MLLLDANIFLEILLDQTRSLECEHFLKTVEAGTQQAILTDLTLDSILIVMESRGKSPSELATFLSSIAAYRGLRLHWLSLSDRLHATEHMRRTHLDFEDSAIYEAGRRLHVDAVVSFDKHFDKLPGLKRLEPKDLTPQKP